MAGGHSRAFLGFVVLVGVWLCAPSQSGAEVFSDLYVGAAVTKDAPYKVDGVTQEPGVLCGAQCGTAKSPIGGLRVGYFVERFPWLGVAGDISYFIQAWGIQSAYEITSIPIGFRSSSNTASPG